MVEAERRRLILQVEDEARDERLRLAQVQGLVSLAASLPKRG
jgi:hypothetical protein